MGRTHVCVTSTALYCCSGDPFMAFMGMMAASLPDQVEGYLPFCSHRGISHNLFLWLGLVALVFFFSWPPLLVPGTVLWRLELGLLLGGLTHVLADALSCQGIPLVAGWRCRLPLYTTGNTSEYVVASLLCFVFFGYGATVGSFGEYAQEYSRQLFKV